MSFLLDTDVVSQAVKPRRDPRILKWMETVDQDSSYISTITLLEIRQGIELMSVGQSRRKLEVWLTDELPEMFFRRVLPVDVDVADQCGRLLAESRRRGWNTGSMDAVIAATAITYGLAVVTLNGKHFEKLGVGLVEF